MRAAGIAKMQEVYGFTVDPYDLPGRYTDMTVDHLFGTRLDRATTIELCLIVGSSPSGCWPRQASPIYSKFTSTRPLSSATS